MCSSTAAIILCIAAMSLVLAMTHRRKVHRKAAQTVLGNNQPRGDTEMRA